MKEIWKDIAGYEGLYMVSNIGNIYSCRNKRNLKLPLNASGYPHVILCDGKSRRTFKVHRIVAEAFIPNEDNKPCINHIDSNRQNNNVKNLEWCTQKENIRHAMKFGDFNTSGTNNGQNKLTVNAVKIILKSNESQSALSRRFGVHQSTISLLVNKKRWKHL